VIFWPIHPSLSELCELQLPKVSSCTNHGTKEGTRLKATVVRPAFSGGRSHRAEIPPALRQSDPFLTKVSCSIPPIMMAWESVQPNILIVVLASTQISGAMSHKHCG
jgi:hypothetical protein